MKARKGKHPKIKWSDEQMRQIMELRRSNASAKHVNKRAYKRRDKYNRRAIG